MKEKTIRDILQWSILSVLLFLCMGPKESVTVAIWKIISHMVVLKLSCNDHLFITYSSSFECPRYHISRMKSSEIIPFLSFGSVQGSEATPTTTSTVTT